MESIRDQRRAQDITYLAVSHAGPQLVDHFLRDDVTLLNFSLINRKASREECGGQDSRYEKSVAHFGFIERVIYTGTMIPRNGLPGIPVGPLTG